MDTVVESHRGKLRGRLSNGVTAFQGVPYAAPQLGANQLRPARAVEPAEALAELVGAGKDGLRLNVWTPDLETAGHPVMVWIPGGMFEFHATGAAAFYGGNRFKPRNRADAGAGPAPTARGRDASGLGDLRRGPGLWLAQVQSRTSGDDARRYNVASREQSFGLGARPVAARAVIACL
jgi:carboxylesterase family protein